MIMAKSPEGGGLPPPPPPPPPPMMVATTPTMQPPAYAAEVVTNPGHTQPIYMGQAVYADQFGRPIVPAQPTVGEPIGPIVGQPPVMGGPSNLIIMQTQTNLSDQQIERMDDFAYTHSLSRSIKCFAIIHSCLVLFNAISSWWLLILLPLPLIGYWGASKFSTSLTMAYAAFIVLAILGRAVWAMHEDKVLYRILQILVILCEIYILRVVIRFIQRVRALSPEDRAFLQTGLLPHNAFVW